jgi:predicted transcriptional regulator of viral defense system
MRATLNCYWRIFPGDSVRSQYKQRYKVIYNIDGDKINVAFIWDCRRNPLALLKIAEQ